MASHVLWGKFKLSSSASIRIKSWCMSISFFRAVIFFESFVRPITNLRANPVAWLKLPQEFFFLIHIGNYKIWQKKNLKTCISLTQLNYFKVLLYKVSSINPKDSKQLLEENTIMLHRIHFFVIKVSATFRYMELVRVVSWLGGSNRSHATKLRSIP